MKAEDFKTVVIPLTGKLYRLALRILGDSSDAKDAVQEVFSKLWSMRERLAEVNNVDAFVTTILRNHCLDKIRTTHTVPMEDFQGRNGLVHPESVEDQFIHNDSARIIKLMIQKLPEMQREIMIMRDLEGLEFEEIQKLTQTNLNHIRVTLSRARKTIRDEMIKLFSFERYVMDHIKKTN